MHSKRATGAKRQEKRKNKSKTKKNHQFREAKGTTIFTPPPTTRSDGPEDNLESISTEYPIKPREYRSVKINLKHTWRSLLGFQSCSTNITVSAPVKFSPSPPTCVVNSKQSIDGSLLNLQKGV